MRNAPDYVFVGTKPFTFHDRTITFEGTVGAVLRREKDTRLWLGQPGRIAAHGETLSKEPAVAPDAK